MSFDPRRDGARQANASHLLMAYPLLSNSFEAGNLKLLSVPLSHLSC